MSDTLKKITFENIEQFIADVNLNFAIVQNSPLYKGVPSEQGIPGTIGLRGTRGGKFIFVKYQNILDQFPGEVATASSINMNFINEKLSNFTLKQKLLLALNVTEFVDTDIIVLTNSMMLSYNFINDLFTDTKIAFNAQTNLASNIETKIEFFVKMYVDNNPTISGIEKVFNIYPSIAKNFTDSNSVEVTTAITPSSIYMPYILGYNLSTGIPLTNHKYYGFDDTTFPKENKGTTIFGSIKKYIDLLTATTSLTESLTYSSDYAPGENNIPTGVFLQDTPNNGLLFGLKNKTNLKNFASIFKDAVDNLIIKSDQSKNPAEYSKIILNKNFLRYDKQVFFEDSLDVVKNLKVSGFVTIDKSTRIGAIDNPWFKTIDKITEVGMSNTGSVTKLRSKLFNFTDSDYVSKVLITDISKNISTEYSLETMTVPLTEEVINSAVGLRPITTIPTLNNKIVTSNYVGFLSRRINSIVEWVNTQHYRKFQFTNGDIKTMSIGALNLSGLLTTTKQIVSILPNGTAPFSIVSKTLCKNLNVEYFNGKLSSAYSLTDHEHNFSELNNTPPSYPPSAHTHEFLPVTNIENLTQRGLKFLQKKDDGVTMPDTGWYHLIRMQEEGWTNGFYADLAFDVNSNKIHTRRKLNGNATLWEYVALESDIKKLLPKAGGITTGMVSMSSPFQGLDDSVNSPLQIRERGLVGLAQSDKKYAPNINFFWANRASKSLFMTANGELHYGNYDQYGIPEENTVWTRNNSGSGSGCDSDKLDGIHGSGYAKAYNGAYKFGGNTKGITTSQFIAHITSIGALSSPYWMIKTTNNFLENDYIKDTGIENLHLSGCTIEVMGDYAGYIVRIITGTTSSPQIQGSINSEYIFDSSVIIQSGVSGWRKIQNNPISIANDNDVSYLTRNDVAISPGRLALAFKGANPVGFPSSQLTSSGWVKLPNGIIFQWGKILVAINHGGYVYFPITFPNSCHSVTGTSQDLTGGNGGILQIVNSSKTNFQWHDTEKSINIYPGNYINWFAVGN